MYKKLIELIPKGEENAVSMSALARLLGVEERDIRRLVLQARCDGELICSSNHGYYYPANDAELIDYYTSLSARFRSTQKVLAVVELAVAEL